MISDLEKPRPRQVRRKPGDLPDLTPKRSKTAPEPVREKPVTYAACPPRQFADEKLRQECLLHNADTPLSDEAKQYYLRKWKEEWNRPHIKGCIFRIGGHQDVGKGILSTVIVYGLIQSGMYTPNKTISNVSYPELDIWKVHNDYIKDFIFNMTLKERRGWLIVGDEFDQILSHATTSSKQRQEILPIHQMVKSENTFIYTQHEGLGVDLILRDASVVTMSPQIDHATDTVDVQLYDGRYDSFDSFVINNASSWYPKYCRWEFTA